MKRSFLFSIIMLGAAGLFAQATETRNLSTFTQVRVADNTTIVLVPGNPPRVDLTIKNITNEKVLTEVSGGEVKFSTQGVLNDAVISGVLYYDQPLRKLTPTYGGTIKSDEPVETDRLEIEAKLDGYTRLKVDVKELVIIAGQGADLFITGRADNVTIEANSGAKVHLEGLECINANVKAGLGSKVWLTAQENYTVKATMGSRVYYKKEPSGKFEKSYVSGGEILME